jgi:putative acetyltransferase
MIQIRRAIAPDIANIVDFHRAVFASTDMGYQAEGELVAALYADDDVVLSLLAEEAGRMIGHAMFSHMTVEADGARLRSAGLAPVGVLPDRHGSGIGSALISTGLGMLADEGFQISFVLGHPHYYPRFGYRAETAAPFASPYSGPHFMALLLDKSLQIPKSGRADYAAAFSR